MDTRREEWMPTRASLIERVRNPGDRSGWDDFYRTYRRLIATLARRRGLTEAEAEDVTQETMIAVLKTMSRFRYDPQRCAFKTWLGRLADARITDFLRRRPASAPPSYRQDATDTALEDLRVDPASLDVDAAWEADWRQGVVDLALRRLKGSVQPLHYQVFYLHAIKGQSPRYVARALGVSAAQVYVVKHRVGRTFKRLVEVVKKELEAREAAALTPRT